jgi:Ser/Thr protein kinase RdoA (MazF antagonist)
MKKVLETVDQEWRSPLGEQLLVNWGYDVGTVFCLRASANFVFEFKKDGKPHYLRFNGSCEKKLEKVQAEMRILHYLQQQSLNVSIPVTSLNNNDVEVVETEVGTFYAVVFEALPGKRYEIEELTEEQHYLWGKSLGKLHHTLKTMPLEWQRTPKNWKDHLNHVQEILPFDDTQSQKELERLLTLANRLDVSAENFGLIHFDFELNNLVFDANNEVCMLDFDDCAYYWYAADLVYALKDIQPFNVESPLVATFIKGYRTETKLDQTTLNEAPLFTRLHQLSSYAKLTRSLDVKESKENPDWLIVLREKLVHLHAGYRASIEKNLTIF